MYIIASYFRLQLFSLSHKQQSLINRVDNALHRIRNLRSTAFTLDKLDDELGEMVLIGALPEDYNSFVSSLLFKDDLDKAAVQIVFVRKDNHPCSSKTRFRHFCMIRIAAQCPDMVLYNSADV